MSEISTTEPMTDSNPASTGSGRWRAAGIHLLLSLLIFALLVALIYGLLFPGGLFSSAGGWEGIRIIAGVDLVLGPLLTLIVFNRNKPRREIVRDLSVVGAIQFAALAAGMFIVYQQRPVLVTFANDRFHVSTQSALSAADVARAELPEQRWLSPFIGYIELPDDKAQRAQIAVTYRVSGEPLHLQMSLLHAMPDEAASRALLAYNALEADADAACVDVIVVSRFGEFERCYDPARKRFGEGPGKTR